MLDSDADFVRTEIRAALKRNVKVIPVLVEDAEVPSPEDLPDDLKRLAPPMLRHRVLPNYYAESDNVTNDHILNAMLENVPVPAVD